MRITNLVLSIDNALTNEGPLARLQEVKFQNLSIEFFHISPITGLVVVTTLCREIFKKSTELYQVNKGKVKPIYNAFHIIKCPFERLHACREINANWMLVGDSQAANIELVESLVGICLHILLERVGNILDKRIIVSLSYKFTQQVHALLLVARILLLRVIVRIPYVRINMVCKQTREHTIVNKVLLLLIRIKNQLSRRFVHFRYNLILEIGILFLVNVANCSIILCVIKEIQTLRESFTISLRQVNLLSVFCRQVKRFQFCKLTEHLRLEIELNQKRYFKFKQVLLVNSLADFLSLVSREFSLAQPAQDLVEAPPPCFEIIIPRKDFIP